MNRSLSEARSLWVSYATLNGRGCTELLRRVRLYVSIVAAYYDATRGYNICSAPINLQLTYAPPFHFDYDIIVIEMIINTTQQWCYYYRYGTNTNVRLYRWSWIAIAIEIIASSTSSQSRVWTRLSGKVKRFSSHWDFPIEFFIAFGHKSERLDFQINN